MTGEAPQPQNNSASDPGKACPFCRETIHPEAKKCRYCGEALKKSPSSKLEQTLKKGMAYLGLATAFLSIFYALREGYYFIEERQEQRAVIESHKAAVRHFEQLDNLDYAVKALEQALAVKPNDLTLQRRYFLLRAHSVLREIEDWGAQAHTDEARETIATLTLDGFRLLHFSLSKPERAGLLIMLGRLLPQDFNWNDEARITSLFEEAYQLAPQDAEVAFRYGLWILANSKQQDKGFELIRKATQLQPENALFWGTLGQYKLKNKAFREALPALQTAIRLRPKQNELQRIRAANSSKRLLRDLLLQAHKDHDITGPEFVGLDMEERKTLLEEALAYNASDRYLNFLAARFYHAMGDHERAVRTLKASLWREDLDRVPNSDISKLELYAAILEKSGQDPETLTRLRDILAQRKETMLYDEALELGHKDKHLYKIGLKVHSGASKDGVLIALAHEGYPFAKAGVRKGDRIFEFAHRKIETLRDIWLPLIEFDPGTELPFKVKRGNDLLNLTLLVE
jgi:tetratricopeptide (TPR) repeat protein